MRTFGTMRLHRRLSARHRGELSSPAAPHKHHTGLLLSLPAGNWGRPGVALGGERCYRTGDAIRPVYPADPAQA